MVATLERPKRTRQISLRLTVEERAALEQIAIRRGLNCEATLRQWIRAESVTETDGGGEAA
jgi:hypothetical protein